MQKTFQVTAQGFAQSDRGIFLDLTNCNHYSLIGGIEESGYWRVYIASQNRQDNVLSVMSSRMAYITRKMHKIVENLTSEDFYTSLSPHFAATTHAKKIQKKLFFI